MPAHSSLKASDSHDTHKSSIVHGGLSALSLKRDAMHSFITTLYIYIPGPQLPHSTTPIE